MAHSLTEVDEFTTSVVVPDDGDTANAASVAAAIQPLANRTKNLNGRLTTAESAKVAGPATATDNAIVRFDGATGKLVQDSGAAIDDSNNLTTDGEYNYATAKSRTAVFHAWEARPDAKWAKGASGMVSSANLGLLDLFLRLPHGAVITEIKVVVDPATSSTDVSVYDYDIDFSTGSASENHVFMGTLSGTSLQVVTMDFSEDLYTVDRGNPLSIRIASSGVSGGDVFYGAQVTFNDPGPRN